jgi:hypothetical protein
VAIAIDRRRTLKEGLSYLQRRTYRSVGEKLLLIWILGFWVSTPLILDWENISKDPSGKSHCVSLKIPYFVVYYGCASFWFPGILLIRIYASVYLEIRRRLQAKLGKANDPEKEGTSHGQSGLESGDELKHGESYRRICANI